MRTAGPTLARLCPALICLLLSGSCSKNEIIAPAGSGTLTLEGAEYDVLSALIDSVFATPGTKLIVLQDSTTLDAYVANTESFLNTTLQYVSEQIPILTPETIEHFKRKNAYAAQIEDSLRLDAPYILLSRTTALQIFRNEAGWNWNEFHSHFPEARGILSASRVGFDAVANQALVYVGYNPGPLAGAGYYYVLSKRQEKWMVIAQVMAWIS